jgi:hypothetical protein
MGSPHGAPPPDTEPVAVPEPEVPEPEVPEPEVPEPEVPVAEPVTESVHEVDDEEEEEDTGDVPVSRSSALIEEALNATLIQEELD